MLIVLFSTLFGTVASLYFHNRAGDFMLVSDMLPVFNQTLFILILSLVVVFVSGFSLDEPPTDAADRYNFAPAQSQRDPA